MSERLSPDDALSGAFLRARRIVIKIGSSLLFDRSARALNRPWLEAMAGDIARLKARGPDVLVVSSGAIALGRHKLGLDGGVLKLEESQAAAAVGQIDLAHAYRAALDPHGITVAQVLLTLTDTEERRRYLNARSTLSTLLQLGAVPVINENDTVATSEIRYGDNDRLAARLAAMVGADWLLLLSDIDGLYTNDPRKDAEARHIPVVKGLSPEILAMAAAPPPKDSSQLGSGGMVTKLEAARIATSSGCHMVISDGRIVSPVTALEAGGRATWFKADRSPSLARKAWIAGSLAPRGTITIDDGALRALERGMSLLPAGVRLVEGTFERGDSVRVVTKEGREVARGLIAYGADDARAIAGAQSRRIEEILGFAGREEMIHRDDLALHFAVQTEGA